MILSGAAHSAAALEHNGLTADTSVVLAQSEHDCAVHAGAAPRLPFNGRSGGLLLRRRSTHASLPVEPHQ